MKLLLHYVFCAFYVGCFYCLGDVEIFAELLLFTVACFVIDAILIAVFFIRASEVSVLSPVYHDTEREERLDVYGKLARLSVRESRHPNFTATECSVCLEAFAPDAAMLLSCGHSFHHTCIFRAFEQCPECPLCRRESVLGVILHNLAHGVL